MKNNRKNSSLAVLLAAAALIAPSIASAIPIAIGYLAWDLNNPDFSGQFSIVNQTGTNSSGDDTWPVATQLTFFDLQLDISFADGSSARFDDSNLTLAADGFSFETGAIAPAVHGLPVLASLSGSYSPTSVTLSDGTTTNLLFQFGAFLNDAAGLSDGALQPFYATAPDSIPVPEPGSATLMALGLGLLGFGLLGKLGRFRGWSRSAVATALMAGIAAQGMPILADAATPVKLNSWTSPDSGSAGTGLVNLTASGIVLPSGQLLSDVTMSLSRTCGGSTLNTAPASSVKPIIGSSYRIQFRLPAELPTGNYFTSLTANATNSPGYASSNCSEVKVAGVATTGWTTLIGRAISIPGNVEAYRCRTIQVPADLYITAVRSPASIIDYERTLTVSDAPVGALGDFNCASDQIGAKMLYAASLGTDDLALPPGVALHVRAGQYLTLNALAANFGTTPVADAVTQIQVQTADASTITAEAELTYAGTFSISIPNDANLHTAAGGCVAPVDFSVFALWPHLRQAGIHAEVVVSHNASATTVLDENFVTANQVIHPVNLSIHQNDQIRVSCAYKNPVSGPNPLTFGDSVTAENCFVGMYRTPVIAPGTDPDLPLLGTPFECVN